MSLDEHDEEYWRHWTTSPVETFEESLQSIAIDGSWIYWHPLMVLQECRGTVLQCVEQTQRSVANAPNETWHRVHLQWQRICSMD